MKTNSQPTNSQPTNSQPTNSQPTVSQQTVSQTPDKVLEREAEDKTKRKALAQVAQS